MTQLEELVAASPEIFARAVKESEDAVSLLEVKLGVLLPADVRWFWTQCGSGDTSAAPSVRMSIDDTDRFRTAIGLPHHYIVLDDRNDAGVVLLDCRSADGPVVWVDSCAIQGFAMGTCSLQECEFFLNFAAWVGDCIEQLE